MLITISILLLLGTPPIYNFLWKAIQPNEMFGVWQAVIDWVYGKGWHKVSDFIGGCQVCFAHFVAWLGYIVWASLWGHWLVFLLWMVLVPVVWYVNLASKLLLDVLAEKAELYKKMDREKELVLAQLEREEAERVETELKKQNEQ